MQMGVLGRFWSRLLTGDGLRKSRLHTYSGRRVDIQGLAYLPRSVWSVCLLKVFAYRQRCPWLGYRAVKHLDRIIQSNWRILEFGSGMSSLFFARRCQHLVSVESDVDWYKQMQLLFLQQNFSNIDYRLKSIDNYTVHTDLPDQSFDLVIVDGLVRDLAAVTSLKKVKPGGYVFFDNSDVPWPEFTAARKTLVDAANLDETILFHDFCPFQVQVNESMLARIKDEQKSAESVKSTIVSVE